MVPNKRNNPMSIHTQLHYTSLDTRAFTSLLSHDSKDVFIPLAGPQGEQGPTPHCISQGGGGEPCGHALAPPQVQGRRASSLESLQPKDPRVWLDRGNTSPITHTPTPSNTDNNQAMRATGVWMNHSGHRGSRGDDPSQAIEGTL